MTILQYDARVPSELLEIQKWFGPLISRPLDENGCLKSTSLKGLPIEREALDYIISSPTLKSHERLELYNRQYWWRLIKNLKHVFSCLFRLFGENSFQRDIAVPYLVEHPPHSWYIDGIGSLLPQWLLENYHETDRELVVLAADIDWLCFSLKSVLNKNPISEADLLEIPISLQPYIGIREFKSDFMLFRRDMVKEPVTHWEEHPFPTCEKRNCFCVVMRDESGKVIWEELSKGEYRFLSLLQEKGFLAEVCEMLEEEVDILEDVQQNLLAWIQRWFPHLTPKIL